METLKEKMRRFLARLNAIDGWLALASLLGFLLFVMICFFFFLERKKPDIQLQLDQKQEELQNFSKSIIEKSRNSDHQKYKIAKIIEKQSNPLVREKTIQELVIMFDSLQVRFSSDAVSINDFQISIDKISVRGSVKSLSTVYEKNGLIDTFASLTFLEQIEVPFYKKYGDNYEFLLEGKIKNTKK